MGGSFESGAGDDPDDLFASGDEDDRSDTGGEQPETATESPPATGSATETPTPESDGPADDQGGDGSDEEPGSVGSEVDAPSADERAAEPATVDLHGDADVDAARLAREFVPASYDKPHAWALGRDGVDDGRTEKKTFFLQERVVDLEAECRAAVNERLGGDVPVTDLRELALVLAYHRPELLAEAAREWGAESA